MENEGRIVELLAEMLIKFDTQTNEFKGLREEFRGLRVDLNTQLEHVENKLEKVESEMVKLNLISSENSRALLKLADYADRINRLEKAVFK